MTDIGEGCLLWARPAEEERRRGWMTRGQSQAATGWKCIRSPSSSRSAGLYRLLHPTWCQLPAERWRGSRSAAHLKMINPICHHSRLKTETIHLHAWRIEHRECSRMCTHAHNLLIYSYLHPIAAESTCVLHKTPVPSVSGAVLFRHHGRIDPRTSARTLSCAPISLLTFNNAAEGMRSYKSSLFFITDEWGRARQQRRGELEERSCRFIDEDALQQHLASGGITVSDMTSEDRRAAGLEIMWMGRLESWWRWGIECDSAGRALPATVEPHINRPLKFRFVQSASQV